ncbi:MAG: hypothetical protein AVDCRST_MAG43-1446 [uncultured Thermomicrobiales bacterium]|uniref:Uncharacterized protein n=1 Tax=uncultured Thermomicrobiales bacterium TaxID=1645740 RepID=A0A6J4UNX8_9BACT|nr:MAG: hypothetical protein AVDCRST_MAG43-1446 [uncultured Thermomicrobiales bacterium]
MTQLPIDKGDHAGTPVARARWRRLLGPLGQIPTPVIFASGLALALVVLWIQGALRDALAAVVDADPGMLLLAAPIYVGSLALLCFRWHALVLMAQGTSDLPKAAEAFLTSVVINYAAPIGLAVPSRAALTKRALGLDAQATGTIAIWEIGMDVAVLGAGTVLWLVLAEGSPGAVRTQLAESAEVFTIGAIGLVALAIVAGSWLLKSPTRRERVLPVVRRMLLAPSARPGGALLALVTTIVYWGMQGIVIALLLRSLDVDHSFEFVLGLTSLPILIGMLSPVPGGAVVREALMYVVARLADVPGDAVIAAAVIYRFALFAAIPILYVVARWWIAHRPEPMGLHDLEPHRQ